MSILVGTASWTDPSLIKCGRFYPAQARSAEERLRYYAGRFPLVEVNSSYYALPSAANAARWAERTPAGFTFNVKAFRLFTGHQTPLDALPASIRSAIPDALRQKKNVYYKDLPAEHLDALWTWFLEALAPLRDAGKLGALHFQFAPWVVMHPRSLDHIAHCRERVGGALMSVEFRHRSWFTPEHRDRTLAFERSHGLTHVVVDEPQGFANTIPQIWETTTPALGIVRLHGRNAQTWNSKSAASASDRFNYNYSDAELGELADSIRQLAGQLGIVHVIFNNNYEDQGQRNATTLMQLLHLQ
jgi:uncharacterized protein YecE (DUF72 family)